ncbi:hypothetical protein D5086_015302 [Populus alba]|uniref:Uncharacterized protein n=1 Tax=Populus alba TaxID=43335 RepID=A0ACC4C1Q2_POPAL
MARNGLVKQIIGSAGGGGIFFTDSSPFAKLLDLCVKLRSSRDARSVHGRLIQTPFCEEVFIQNRLIDVYGKCGYLDYARKVFDRMSEKNVFSYNSIISTLMRWGFVDESAWLFSLIPENDQCSWNSMIAGFAQHDRFEEALDWFVRMHRDDFVLNDYSFGSGLSACSRLKDLKLGAQIHGLISKSKYSLDVFMGSGLIDFYSKCGMPVRNAVSETTMFGEEPDIFVGNSLIDMYMKCGSVEEGLRVFENMVEKDHVSWNTMIVGYAQNGYGMEALELFQKMLESGEKPDHVTMIGTLCACSHTGLVEEGRRYFFSMTKEHGLLPVKDHYTCMVDLLGRAGCLEEAKDLIESMPKQPDAVVWSSLLSACKVHRNITLGKWGDAVSVRKLMRRRGVVKQPGCSWIDIQSNVHVFMVKDKRHPQKKEIYSILKLLTRHMRQAGYVPDASDHEAYEEPSELESSSCFHMEMQAEAAVM